MVRSDRPFAVLIALTLSVVLLTAQVSASALLWLCTDEFCNARGGICTTPQQCTGPGKYEVYPDDLITGAGTGRLQRKGDADSVGGQLLKPICCTTNPQYIAAEAKCREEYNGTCIPRENCAAEPITDYQLCKAFGNSAGVACCPLSDAKPELNRGGNTVLSGNEAVGSLEHTSGDRIQSKSTIGCNWRSPGCTSLDGIEGHALKRLQNLFPGTMGECALPGAWRASNPGRCCNVTIIGGTEYGHDDSGLETHQGGKRLLLEGNECVTRVATETCAGAPAARDPRCTTETTGCDGVKFCQLKTRTGNDWEVTFPPPAVGQVDATRLPNVADQLTVEACITEALSLTRVTNGDRYFPTDYGFLQRHARSCSPARPDSPGCRNTSSSTPSPIGGVDSLVDPVTGGVFQLSPAQFGAAQLFACSGQDPELTFILRNALGGSDFCALEYRAADSCIVSALATLLYLNLNNPIPETVTAQQTLFTDEFIGNGADCDAAFFPTPPVCPDDPPPPERCSLRIGIVLDESGSIKKDNFLKATGALTAFVESNVLTESTRVALVKFSTTERLVFNFSNTSVAAEELRNTPYNGGWTKTHLGMQKMLDLFPPSRDVGDSYFILLVVTDGKSTEEASLKALTDRYQASYGHVIPMSVGIAGFDLKELKQIAQGKDENVLTLQTFQGFVDNMDTLLKATCQQTDSVDLGGLGGGSSSNGNNTSTNAPPSGNSTNSSGSGNVTAVNDPNAVSGSLAVSLPKLELNEARFFKIDPESLVGEDGDLQGVGLRLRSDEGCLVGYGSQRITRPGPAQYDFKLDSCADSSETLVNFANPSRNGAGEDGVAPPKRSATNSWVEPKFVPGLLDGVPSRRQFASLDTGKASKAPVYLRVDGATDSVQGGKLVVTDPSKVQVTKTIPVPEPPATPEPTPVPLPPPVGTPRPYIPATMAPPVATPPPDPNAGPSARVGVPSQAEEETSCGTSCFALIALVALAGLVACVTILFVVRRKPVEEEQKKGDVIPSPYLGHRGSTSHLKKSGASPPTAASVEASHEPYGGDHSYSYDPEEADGYDEDAQQEDDYDQNQYQTATSAEEGEAAAPVNPMRDW